jgi:hypothetical protein
LFLEQFCLKQLSKKGEVRKVMTIEMIDAPQLSNHTVSEPKSETTANPNERGETCADAVTSENNVMHTQPLDKAIPSDSSRVPDIIPHFNGQEPQRMSPVAEQRHETVDAVLPGAHNAEKQGPPRPQEESDPPVARRFSKVPGPQEIFLTENNESTYRKVFLHVEAGDESSVQDIVERRNTLRHPMRGLPLPTHEEPYGATGELFTEIKKVILEQTSLGPG